MLFNSFSFLLFFGVVAGLYYALPHRFRWLLLLVASLYFYAAFDPRYVVLLTGILGVTYAGGLLIAREEDSLRRRGWLTGSVTLVLSALLVFKYYDFLLDSGAGLLGRWGIGSSLFPLFPRLDVVVLVGLSFYTFSCVSYLVDVHARRLAPERHFGYFAVYVAYFPKLLAGPIERARPFLEQLRTPVRFDPRLVTLGLQLMLWGLFKKVVVADNLVGFVDAAYSQPAFASPADLLIATYFFAFQLYCDFSGYSDMAIGTSLVMGIRLMENFRRPYLSATTREFWSARWHLSLASWFRDYLYIPLGGSRVHSWRRYFNVMVVFLVSGLWHGANWTFVVWGGLNGLYNVLGDVADRTRRRIGMESRIPAGLIRGVGVVTTFHLILSGWVFFRAASIGDALTIYSRVGSAWAALPEMLWNRAMTGEVLYPIALILILVCVEILDERVPLWDRLRLRSKPIRWGVYYAILIAILVLGSWQSATFVYMQF